MIRIFPGDLVRVEANENYYYVMILDKITLFGGQLCYVFYRKSEVPLEADEILRDANEGFFEIVDFIWAKRENRISRIAKKIDTSGINQQVKFFKNTHTTKGKAKEWWIYDREGREIRRTPKLTKEEIQYPLFRRIDDIMMVSLIEARWSPEQDNRI